MFDPMVSLMIATHLEMVEFSVELLNKLDTDNVEILSNTEISHLVMCFTLLEQILNDLQDSNYVSISIIDNKVLYNDGRD